VEILGWSLVVLAVLIVTGLIGPLVGAVLTVAALPFLLVLGVVLLPLFLLLLVVSALLGVLGFMVQFGLPLLLLGLGIWLIVRKPQRRLTA
jgi:hypothetical protein